MKEEEKLPRWAVSLVYTRIMPDGTLTLYNRVMVISKKTSNEALGHAIIFFDKEEGETLGTIALKMVISVDMD